MTLVLHCDESVVNNSFTFKLANLEYQLFRRGRKSMFAYRLWKAGKAPEAFRVDSVSRRKKVKTR